jgi:hypothetical protein
MSVLSSMKATGQESHDELQRGLKTQGQRRINLVWEVTQSLIALGVTSSTLYVSSVMVLRGEKSEAAILLLSNAFFLVVGFYFGRTNHDKTGGVGTRNTQESR